MNKEEEFEKMFCGNVIDIKELQRMSYGGIPTRYRPLCWRILLGVSGYGLRNQDMVRIKKNRMYMKGILGMRETESSVHEDFDFKNTRYAINSIKSEQVEKYRHQIQIDLDRLSKDRLIFENFDVSFMVQNILSVFAMRRPAVGYVQGMCDIAQIFVHVFCTENLSTAESNAFYCFCRFIDAVQSNFTEHQPRIFQYLDKMGNLLKEVDAGLYEHFNKIDLNVQIYAFRWFNCFMIREFNQDLAYTIFDSILAYGDPNRFVLYFGLALLVSYREKLLASDFSETVLFLQEHSKNCMGESELQTILRLALLIERRTEEESNNNKRNNTVRINDQEQRQ